MFTGLVECTGKLRSVKETGGSRRFTIEAGFWSELNRGESVAVGGVCLTVEALDTRAFEVTAVAETLSRSTLATSRPGQALNLERSLRLSDRLGGHLVSGHVDCLGRVLPDSTSASGRILAVEFPVEYDPFLVAKGSIAVDGVSLTVVQAESGRFTVALIPETCQITTLGHLRAGDQVNLEFDLVAKYIWRQQGLSVPGAEVREETLRV